MSSSERPSTLISGAASGIGRHMAISLARAGHRLTLTDIDTAGLARLAEEQSFQQSDVLLHTLDVRDADGWRALIERSVQTFGPLDLMLNVAGFLKPGNLIDIDRDGVDRQLDINVKGCIYATQAGARQMIEQKRGHIINIASIAGLSHVPGMSVYCASKHAVRGFSLSVAHELRPHGVKLTVFCPDAVETPMLTLQEAHPEAAMTFGGGRALSLVEVERALLAAMKTAPLELVLGVPGSGRAIGAKLANMFPRLTGLAAAQIRKNGARLQQKRLSQPR